MRMDEVVGNHKLLLLSVIETLSVRGEQLKKESKTQNGFVPLILLGALTAAVRSGCVGNIPGLVRITSGVIVNETAVVVFCNHADAGGIAPDIADRRRAAGGNRTMQLVRTPIIWISGRDIDVTDFTI